MIKEWFNPMETYRVFDEYSKRYDEWFERNREVFESELLAVSALGLRGSGLDVGVGTGMFSASIGVRYGIDPSINMLRVAKTRGVEVVRALGERIPFRDGCFDYILVVDTICFLQSLRNALSEAKRVLKSGGIVAVCLIPKDSPWGRLYQEKAREGHPFYARARFYTLAEVEEVLSGLGLKILEYWATLSYGPRDEPYVEAPTSETRDKGFVCLKAQR